MESVLERRFSFLTPPAPVAESEITETVDVDIVIAGAGLAGLVAALRASELGASVAVLEKTKSWNVRGGHISAINSRLWRGAGVVNDKKEFVREWIGQCGNRAREEIVWLYANHSEEAMDWLLDHSEAHGNTPRLGAPRYVGPTYTEMYGACLFKIQNTGRHLYEDAAKLGARFYFETPATQLIKENGRVVAVIGKTPNGFVRFRAKKGVILATGDIHGDKEMIAAYCPIFLKVKNSQYAPAGANTGDGHKMGLWVGGVMEDKPLPTIMHPQGYNRLQSFFLFVNTRGERFMNEDTWCQAKSLNVLKQPGNVDYAYAIMDADWREQLLKGMPYSGGLFNDNSISVYGEPFTGEREQMFLETGLENGQVQQADTIEELAEKIEVPAHKLRETVDTYNKMVEKMDDTQFGKRAEVLFPIKKPPFYASKFGPAMLAVTGGLITDTHLRVVDKEHRPIPGLYAVGNVAGGLYGIDYPTLIPGNSHGRALTWGYLAAKNALEDGKEN